MVRTYRRVGVGPVGVELPSWSRWTFASCALLHLGLSNGDHSPGSRGCPPTIGRREAMFWTASDTIISCRGAVSRRADASIPSANSSRRPGEALDERAPDKTTNSPGRRRDRFGAHTANQRWSRELALQGFKKVVSRAIDPSIPAPVVALRIAHPTLNMPSSGAICSQLATQERPNLDPWPSPHVVLLVDGKLVDADQRSATVRNGRGDNLGGAVTQLSSGVQVPERQRPCHKPAPVRPCWIVRSLWNREHRETHVQYKTGRSIPKPPRRRED